MMTSLQAVSGSLLYYLLGAVSLLLVIAQINVLIQTIRYRREKRIMIIAVLNILLCFALFVILMDFAVTRFISPEDEWMYKPFEWALFALPWLLYAVIEIVCIAVLCLLLRSNRRYRNSHLTPDAIRQTLDLLPAGICISDDKGTVLLSNLKMNEICRELTGRLLSDADRFFDRIEADAEEQNGSTFVKLPNGTVCRFERKPMEENGKQYHCLMAIDVTERYRVTVELKAKNEHLQDVRRRMQAVSDLSGDMFVAQEEAAARAALHNQLGQVLLMGRHYLQHPDTTDADLVYITTTQMNSFLLGEYHEPTDEDDDLLTQVFMMVKAIGVTVEVQGSLPEQANHRAILAHAIQECAANTVKHAQGNRLMLVIAEKENHTDFVITNNGNPPKGEIAESGGLLSLRRSVEETGGTMTVQSQPVFSLTFKL